MTQFVVLADGWTRVTEWTDQVPAVPKKWEEYSKGDVVELDPDNDRDAGDIQRLAAPHVTFRPALVEKSVHDEVNRRQQRAVAALNAARAATLSSPFATNPFESSDGEEGEGHYPEGQRVDGAPSTVGVGGTDPEPQGLTGEAGGASYDDEDEWKYSDLQQAARARGLSAGGSRAEIIRRLKDFDEDNAAPLSVAAASGELNDDDKRVALREGNSAQPDQA